MSIFDFAMQMEQDGEKFYRDLAEATANAGLKKIFSTMADDEVEHYRIFKGLKEKTTPEISDSTVLSQAKTVFAEMKESGKVTLDDSDQTQAYQLALEAEKKSYTFYEEKAEETEDDAAKKLLLTIANEEKRHYRLLENVIDFVSRPESWLEDAEFSHLEEY